jgi:glycosyltransferase involved in cell wall biosynthesis
MSLLSVITINYNNLEGLKKTFDSVFGQTEKQFEYIVIDGGSTDGSVDLIRQDKERIAYWISEPDKGIYDAMNKGIEKASGEYLLFLNSGDLLADRDTLEKALPELGKEDIVYGNIVTVSVNGAKKYLESFDEAGVYNLLMSTIWHPAAFIRKDLFSRCGRYSTELKMASDYEFFIRSILMYGATCRHISQYIAVFDLGGVSNQKKNEEEMKAERELAWKLNFSDVMIGFFKEYAKIYRSGEYKLGKMITRFLPA